MKFLALERELTNDPDAFQPYLHAEAEQAWALYQTGVLRECYFRADQHTAVLILECADTAEAREVLDSLPLVKAGLIAFDVLPLMPYTGFARLFGDTGTR